MPDIRDNTVTPATPSVEHRARRLADQHPNGTTERCAALVVAVATREMSTPERARRLIAEHFAGRPRNADIGVAALALLEQLTTMTTTGGTPDV